MTEFSYEFEEMEVLPGVMVWGDADFVKRANGTFEMMGLRLYWHGDKPKLTLTNSSDWFWSAIETAFIEMNDRCGILSDACEKEESKEEDPDDIRDRRLEYIRIGLL